jgi:hypothetical protein
LWQKSTYSVIILMALQKWLFCAKKKLCLSHTDTHTRTRTHTRARTHTKSARAHTLCKSNVFEIQQLCKWSSILWSRV